MPCSQAGIAGWDQVGSYNESTLFAGEGVATVFRPRRCTYEPYRGILSNKSDPVRLHRVRNFAQSPQPSHCQRNIGIGKLSGVTARSLSPILVEHQGNGSQDKTHTRCRDILVDSKLFHRLTREVSQRGAVSPALYVSHVSGPSASGSKGDERGSALVLCGQCALNQCAQHLLQSVGLKNSPAQLAM